MAATPQPVISGLGRALIQHGRLSEADAIACTTAAGNNLLGFINELAQRKLISQRDVAMFAAQT
ncbi:MAG: type IV-A pilus assembly ATPase PilB, partial [Rhodocyclaceae bacterium]|nr:type IV-A pilus assembly ATPase PilB [Rhodocyclaceae bacterium]